MKINNIQFPDDTDVILTLEPSNGREIPLKAQWLDGPWRDEPDKVTWVDPKTGLHCMIIRNFVGSLCGYVGVSADHPWYKITYNGCTKGHMAMTPEAVVADAKRAVTDAEEAYKTDPSGVNKAALAAMVAYHNLIEAHPHPFDRWHCTDYSNDTRCPTPEGTINVHGGLTYSEHNSEGTRISLSSDMDLWWFGFDCGHYMDFQPGMQALLDKLDTSKDPGATYDPVTGTRTTYGIGEVYRTLSYVKDEVESLALQLKEIARND